ncbi:MAG TPA: hypothetical protein PLK89_13865 [Acidobacteriota bacterium]|nr:hypothetical protein [Acidobacteriota bacterium]
MNRIRATLIAALLTLLAVAAGAAVPAVLPPGHSGLAGFDTAVAGERLRYHSFHPYARESLLTRVTDGRMAIEWTTAPAPDPLPAAPCTFVWIGAHSTGTSGGDRAFDLELDGRPALRFVTRAGGVAENWTVRGAGGVALSFRHVWTDHVGDAFGYMLLEVPAALLAPGRPVTVRVTGVAAGSRDWYMTFMYAFRSSMEARPQPALVRTPDGERQLVELWIDHTADSGAVVVQAGSDAPATHPLRLGLNVLDLLAPPAAAPTPYPVSVRVDGRTEVRLEAVLRPVRRRAVHLLPHSHNDIGYTHLQSEVLEMQLQNLADAVRLIRRTADYPAEAQFRWNAEILWAVEEYLYRAGVPEHDAFIDAVRSGHMGLQALYTNPLTGLLRPEEMIRLTDCARRLAARHGLKIDTAMITDIPGVSWGAVPALAHAGIRYFSSGPNASDRIGRSTEAWGDRPFWWVGPSGQDKLLYWVAGKGYSLFHQTSGIRSADARPKLFGYLAELEAVDYPYDLVQLRYTIYSDNGPADAALPDFVREWNERYASPRLVINTADRLFAEFERRHGATLPAFAGDLTPHWEDGAASTARELGLARRASERLVQAETLAAVVDGRYDPQAFYCAWREVHLADEHTWGAWNSVSDPDHPNAVGQWRLKQAFTEAADRLSRELLETVDALEDAPAADASLDVINTCSWTRTDLVVLPAAQSRAGDRVVDADGRPVPSQRLASGELAVLAADVPPLGGRRFRVTAGNAPAGGTATAGDGRAAASGLAVRLDPATGTVTSLAAGGRELVDAGAYGLNEYLYVAGKSPADVRRAGTVRITAPDAGPLVATLRVESDTMPGARALVREYRLVDGLDWLAIRNELDKTAVRDKEAVYFAFPFAVPDAVARLDLGWGFIRPEADQLPGACRDFFTIQRWADVSNQRHGVTWATVEAPLVSVGAMVDETAHNDGPAGWKAHAAASGTLFAYTMNNYWHTNYKADQAGTAPFTFAVRPHGLFDALAAYRFGVERSQPLLARPARGVAAPKSLFTVDSPAVVVTSLIPLPEGDGMLVRLYNAGGRPETTSLQWRRFHPAAVWLSNPAGERLRPVDGPLSLPAFGLATLRVEGRYISHD